MHLAKIYKAPCHACVMRNGGFRLALASTQGTGLQTLFDSDYLAAMLNLHKLKLYTYYQS